MYPKLHYIPTVQSPSPPVPMKDYPASHIRNFAVVGHTGAGKTLLCEAMLLRAGVLKRLGSIAAGTTASDYHQSERDHKISMHATPLDLEWLDRKFNLLDCPGSSDFIAEGLGALRVGDFALVVIHAGSGVQAGTEQAWDYATRHNLPKIVVINGVDKENASFDRVLSQARDSFGKELFPLSLPVNPGPGFNSELDVLRSEVIEYAGDASGAYTEKAAEGEWAGRVKELHRQLIEYVAEADDTLLEKYFNQGGLSETEFRAGIHAAVQSQHFVPVFCTSAERNVGVARLMDFIAKYGSSPVDRECVEAVDAMGRPIEVHLASSEPVAYVFKTLIEPHVGELSFFRVYSGTFETGGEYFNSDRKITERLGQLYLVNGHDRTPVERVTAGDIAAVVKLKDTHTGNTLCSVSRPVTLPKVQYPTPTIHGALHLNTRGEEERIAVGLQTLHEEDPTFLHRWDPETRETVISGQGDIHLQVIAERLKRRFNVHIELQPLRIPYRETIRSAGDARYRHKKQTGGAGQFAEVWLRITPGERDSGVQFASALAGQNVDRVYVPSVEKGVRRACEEGILTHHRITDVQVEFYDGKMHSVDSNDVSFQVAGYHAFREAFSTAQPCLLEPIYDVRIRVPDDAVGSVMGDISARHGKILGVDTEGRWTVVQAQVPQRELYRYATTIRSLTGGRGSHTEAFSHYEEVPPEMQARLAAELEAKRKGAVE